MLPRAVDGRLVARIGVPHHAGGGVVPQHAFKPPRREALLLNVVWSEPVSGNRDADFITVFSSLTFGYAAQRAGR